MGGGGLAREDGRGGDSRGRREAGRQGVALGACGVGEQR